jgi:hypothetical protein
LIKYFPSDDVWLERIEQKTGSICENEGSLPKLNARTEEILEFL